MEEVDGGSSIYESGDASSKIPSTPHTVPPESLLITPFPSPTKSPSECFGEEIVTDKSCFCQFSSNNVTPGVTTGWGFTQQAHICCSLEKITLNGAGPVETRLVRELLWRTQSRSIRYSLAGIKRSWLWIAPIVRHTTALLLATLFESLPVSVPTHENPG